MADSDYIKNIIFLRTDSIGDNIIAMSTLPFIREKYPGANIVAVCQEHIRPLYESCPHVDGILTYNWDRCNDELESSTDHIYLKNLSRQIKAINADLLINTVYSREEITEIFVKQAEAKRTIGFYGDLCNIIGEVWDYYKPLYTDLVTTKEGTGFEVDRLKKFLTHMGIDSPPLNPKIWLSDEDQEFAEKVFNENNFSPESTITLFLGSNDPNREYDKYGAVLSLVCNDRDINVIALGADSNYEAHQKVLEQLGSRTLNLCGKTIRQSAAVMKKVKLNVGVETVFAQIACAVESPNFIIYGGGFFGRFLPFSKLTSVVCLPIDCYGCNYFCKYIVAHCTKSISELLVAKALVQTLDEPSDKPRIFVQDQSLWFPKENEPKWQSFEKFINMDNVEIVSIDRKSLELPAEVLIGIKELKEIIKQKNLSLAEFTINRLLPDFPYSPELLGLKAEIALLKGNFPEAKRLFLILVNLYPDNTNFLEKTAITLWENGKVFQAINFFNKVLILNQQQIRTVINYADAFYEIGLFEQMKSLYWCYLAYYPDDHPVRNRYINKILNEAKENLVKRENINEDKYLVTAIVSACNSERFISGCIEDLQEQTIADKLEIIIIDSNSQQNEEIIVKPYLEKYPNTRYIKTREKETVYASWNRAIKLSSGKYLTIANAEDRHKTDAFEIMVKELEENPDIALVYADSYITKTENSTFNAKERIDYFNLFNWERSLLFLKCFMGPQPMWKRKVHDEYGYFDPGYEYSGDYEFWFRISQTNNFKKINQCLGLYFDSPESILNSNGDKLLEESNQIIRIYKEALDKGEIINRKNPLPVLSFNQDNKDININTDTAKAPDVFIEYKFNPDGKINHTGYYILAQKWECWSLPQKWIGPLIRNVDQIWVPTAFVKNAYIQSGIKAEKIEIIPTGIDTEKFSPLAVPLKLETKAKFKFLFVGSLLKRKGIDLLLEAYTEEFTPEESICLVIKDDLIDVNHENTEFREKIKLLKENAEIIFYSGELSEAELPGLYRACNCFVYPYRTEGFGLHALEAMASQIPVVITGSGASADFADQNNSWLINAAWEYAGSNKLEMMELVDDIYWFQPEKNHLKKLMREVFNNRNEAALKAEKGRNAVIEKYSWQKIMQGTLDSLNKLSGKPITRDSFYADYEFGLWYMKRENYQEAINEFIPAMKKGLDTNELFASLAFCLEKRGDQKTADYFYKKAGVIKHESSEILKMKQEDIKNNIREPVTKSPYPPELATEDIFIQQAEDFFAQGLKLMDENNYGEALLKLDEAMYRNVNIENLLYKRAVCLFHLERFDEAAAALRTVLKKQPENSDALKLLEAIKKDNIEP